MKTENNFNVDKIQTAKAEEDLILKELMNEDSREKHLMAIEEDK